MASQPEDSSALIKLSYREKVPVGTMKDILKDCLTERLTNAQYEGERCHEAAKQLADLMRSRLKALNYDRYKFVVQVLLGERREQGMYFGTRCFWDANTDNQASESFTNVRLPSHDSITQIIHLNLCIYFYTGSHLLRSHSICDLPLLVTDNSI
jgi:tctex1 domain-containing protein 2